MDYSAIKEEFFNTIDSKLPFAARRMKIGFGPFTPDGLTCVKGLSIRPAEIVASGADDHLRTFIKSGAMRSPARSGRNGVNAARAALAKV